MESERIPTGVPTLLPIRVQELPLAICALANIRRDDENGSMHVQAGAARVEFTLADLERSIGFSERALRDRYGEGDIIRNPQFLADIHIPVTVEENETLGLCLEVSAFDEVHGHGAAETALRCLRDSLSTDTRRARYEFAQSADDDTAHILPVSTLPLPTLPLYCEGDPMKFTFENGQAICRCASIRTRTVLELLYGLLCARRDELDYELETITPITPKRAYQLIPRSCSIIGIDEPSDHMIAQAIKDEFGYAIETLGSEIRLHGVSRAFVGEWSCLISDYRQRQRWFFDRCASVVGTLVSLPAAALLGLCAFEIEPMIGFIEEGMMTMTAFLCAGSIWAPFRLAYLGYRGTFFERK